MKITNIYLDNDKDIWCNLNNKVFLLTADLLNLTKTTLYFTSNIKTEKFIKNAERNLIKISRS